MGELPETADMVVWALRHPREGGVVATRDAILTEFGCTKSVAARVLSAAVASARSLITGAPDSGRAPAEPLALESPALAASRRFEPTDPAYRAPTVQKLRSTPLSLVELAQFLGTGEQDAALMLSSLRSTGYMVEEAEGRYRLGKLRPETAPAMLSFARLESPVTRLGFVADTHIDSTKQRLDVLEMAYEEFSREGVSTVFHGGNLLDGYREAINGGEVMHRNCEDQCIYAADHYPQRSGVTTHFITGECHEGWWTKAIGLNIGHYVEDAFRRNGRKDMRYAGHMERDVELRHGRGRAVLRLFHPGGGSAYALSYKPQKFVESYQGGEKPALLWVAHYHKLLAFCTRNVWVLLGGCCQDQTRWMRKQGIEAHVGYSIVEIQQDENGAVSSLTPKMRTFFDKQYHLDLGEWEQAVAPALEAS